MFKNQVNLLRFKRLFLTEKFPIGFIIIYVRIYILYDVSIIIEIILLKHLKRDLLTTECRKKGDFLNLNFK